MTHSIPCFVVAENWKSVTEKWNCIQSRSGGLWPNVPTCINGDLYSFINADAGDKVILLACHCDIMEEASDRRFYNRDNDVEYTYKEIERMFHESSSNKLFLWLLTCENANADVLISLYNRQNEHNNCEKRIYPRVIVSETDSSCMVTDEYILHVLSNSLEQHPFPDLNPALDYNISHLENGVESKNEIVTEDTVTYGKPSLLLEWVNKIKADFDTIEGPEFTDDKDELVCWKHADKKSRNSFRHMEIHTHVSYSTERLKYEHDKIIHAKASRHSRSHFEIRKENYPDLYAYLDEAATVLVNKSKNSEPENSEAKGEYSKDNMMSTAHNIKDKSNRSKRPQQPAKVTDTDDAI